MLHTLWPKKLVGAITATDILKAFVKLRYSLDNI